MAWLGLLLASLVLYVLVAAVRLLFSLPRFLAGSATSPTGLAPRDAVVMVVLGSGGHTSEMLSLVQHLELDKFHRIVYVVANTDHTSLNKLRANPRLNRATNVDVRTIPRAREVLQSYTTSVLTTLYASCFALVAVFRERPALIIANGPGTCLPICMAGLLLRFVRLLLLQGGRVPKVLFVESFCRVKTLSLTGKLLYPLADVFVVHWDALVKKYPRAQNLGVVL